MLETLYFTKCSWMDNLNNNKLFYILRSKHTGAETIVDATWEGKKIRYTYLYSVTLKPGKQSFLNTDNL